MSSRLIGTFSLAAFVIGLMMHCNTACSQDIDPSVSEFYASCIGDWDVTFKNWGAPDIKQPDMFSGTATSGLFGASWLVSELTLENGLRLRWTLGYSSKDSAFSGFSIVNFSPYEEQQHGEYDQETMTLTLSTKSRDVVSGARTEGKMELVVVDRTERILSMFRKDRNTGEFRKSAEMIFKRQEAKARKGARTKQQKVRGTLNDPNKKTGTAPDFDSGKLKSKK